MATKARQQYFADEDSLQKIRREFSIADDIQQKIDSIEEGAQVNVIETVKVNGTPLIPDANKAVNVEVPEVIDNLYTVDSDNALSAKQGKLLYDYIQNIASRGRFLSNWNSATGLPMTNPSESLYPYKSGDYFVVSNVAGLGGTNYRPDGSSYIIGQASTVVETESVDVSDFYFYDGTTWLLLKNSSRSGAVDSSLSTTSTNPVENRVITQALNGKQDTLIAGTNIQIAADGKTISATDTTYTAGTGINIDANNVISNTQTSAEWGNITGTLSNQTDLQNVLDGKADITDVNTKTFFLTGTTGETNINTVKNAIAYYEEGKNPILFYRDESDSTEYGAYLLKGVAHNTEVQGDVSYLFTRIGQRHGSNGWVGDDKLDVYKAGNYVGITRTVEGKIYAIAGEPESAVNQDIYGVKTFHSAPVVPSKSTSAGNNPTTIATEAQVYLKQDKLTAGTGINIDANNVISATGGSDIVYATQAEYNALLPGAESDGKHYFIYTSSTPTPPFTPGVNTVAYYPLDTDFNDASGNSRNLTNSGATITTVGDISCGYWDGSATTYYQGFSLTREKRTISMWIRGIATNDNVGLQIAKRNSGFTGALGIMFYSGVLFSADGTGAGTSSVSVSTNTWYYAVSTQEGSVVNFYANGVLIGTESNRPDYSTIIPDGWALGSQNNTGAYAKLNGYMSNVILEDKVRTAQEIQDYYNQTKANYGIS